MAIVLESSASDNANATTVTVAKPSGTASGDLLVAIWGIRASKSSANLTLPSGFSETVIEGGQNPTLQISYKVAGGSEPANYTFTSNTSANQGCILARFSGVDTSSPSDATGSANTGSGQTATASGVTTGTNGAVLIAGYVLNLTGSSYSIDTTSSMTQIQEIEGTVMLDGFYLAQATAGASGDKTASIESAGANWAACLWAVKPAATSVQLTIQDATHGHTVDNLDLTQHNILEVQDSAHGHSADNVALTQHNVLAVQDASHAHTADGPLALVQHHVLTVQDSTHGHTVDGPLGLTQHNVLVIQDALHGHTADSPALTQHNALAVQDATHGHTADNVELTAHPPGAQLVIQDATHGHTVDNVALVQHNVLAVQDALHGHLADNVDLTQHNVLTIQDTFHYHYADGPLTWPGSGTLGNDMAGLWSVFLRRKKKKARVF